MLVVQEALCQLGLVQTRPAEISSGGPVTEEGADTAPGSWCHLLAHTLHRVQRSGAVLGTQTKLLSNLSSAGPAGGARHLQTLRRVATSQISLKTNIAEHGLRVSVDISAVLLATILDGLHDVLRAGVPAVLPVGGPGAGGEEAAPAPIHTPAVAVGGAVAAPRQALATLEGLRLAVAASADGFVWI